MPPPTFLATYPVSGEPGPVPGGRESATEAISAHLLNIRLSDNDVRLEAEYELNVFANEHTDAFMCAVAKLLETERPGDCALRVQAAVALAHRLPSAWIILDASSKEIVKSCLLRSVRHNLPTALRDSLLSAFVVAVGCVCAPVPSADPLAEWRVRLHKWPQFLTEFCLLLGSEVPHRRFNALMLLGLLARQAGREGNDILFLDEPATILESLETGLRDQDLQMQLAAVTATCRVDCSLLVQCDELNVKSLCPLILDVMKCMVENDHSSKAQSVIELFACEGTWLFDFCLKEFAQFLLQVASMFGAEDEGRTALSRTALEALVCIFEQQELWHRPHTMPIIDPLLHLCIEFLAQSDLSPGTVETGQMYISRVAEALGCDLFFDPAFCVILEHLKNAACWRYRRAALFAAAEVRDGCQARCEKSQEHFDYIVELVSFYKHSDPQNEVCLAAAAVLDRLEGVDVRTPMVLE